MDDGARSLGATGNRQGMPRAQPGKSWSRTLIWLPALFAALVYLPLNTNRAVIDYDEGYYAQPALHMARHGDWVTPLANGVRFLEKPPLAYWLSAASFRIFGINEFALRLPTSLGVVALVWIVTLTARRASGERAALVAGLSTAFSAGTFLFTREALHDIWLVLFLSLAMYAFLEWHLDSRHPLRPALLFYAALAGAAMSKSLVGVAFPVGTAAVFFLLVHERPAWRSLHVLPGSLLFLALTVPWHVLAAIRNRGFLWYFFVNEQVLRFFGKHDPSVVWSLPLLAFWLLLLVWFFPWTAFLPAAYEAARKQADPSRHALVMLALAWAGVILGFFSISGRLEHYAFPALPALSLLVGVALGGFEKSRTIKWGFGALAGLGVALLAGGIITGIWFSAAGTGSATGTRTNVISETDFSILAEMPSSIIRDLSKPAAVTVGTLALGFLAALWLDARQRRLQAVLCVSAAMMVVCGMVHWSLTICEGMISSKRFGLAIAANAAPGDRVVVMGDYESANSLNFYEPWPVEVCGGVAYALMPGMKYPDAPQIVLTQKEFETVWKSPESRVFALVPKARLGDLTPAGMEILRVLDRVLVRNH